jgi:hypothetical protein
MLRIAQYPMVGDALEVPLHTFSCLPFFRWNFLFSFWGERISSTFAVQSIFPIPIRPHSIKVHVEFPSFCARHFDTLDLRVCVCGFCFSLFFFDILKVLDTNAQWRPARVIAIGPTFLTAFYPLLSVQQQPSSYMWHHLDHDRYRYRDPSFTTASTMANEVDVSEVQFIQILSKARKVLESPSEWQVVRISHLCLQYKPRVWFRSEIIHIKTSLAGHKVSSVLATPLRFQALLHVCCSRLRAVASGSGTQHLTSHLTRCIILSCFDYTSYFDFIHAGLKNSYFGAFYSCFEDHFNDSKISRRLARNISTRQSPFNGPVVSLALVLNSMRQNGLLLRRSDRPKWSVRL